MRDLVALGKAFAEPTRVRAVAALCHGELCVCELVDALQISQSTLSGYLQILRPAELVTTRKDGRWIYYVIEPQQAGLVEALFAQVEAEASADPRRLRDSERIERRLAIREKGRCTRGVGELRQQGKEEAHV